MHRLTSSFVLGYHGCDRQVGERLLEGALFEPSNNDYDWLGPGVYFWESNPQRGLEFAAEVSGRKRSRLKEPFVVGAVIDLGLCLDLTSSNGIQLVQASYHSFAEQTRLAGSSLPTNSGDSLRRALDCAVVKWLHVIRRRERKPPADTVKGTFTEGGPAYPGAGFAMKTHTQIAVRNLECIKGVFRVPYPA